MGYFFDGHEAFWSDLPFDFLIGGGVFDDCVLRACLCALMNGEMKLRWETSVSLDVKVGSTLEVMVDGSCSWKNYF